MDLIIKSKLKGFSIITSDEIKSQHEWIIKIIHNVGEEMIGRKLQSIDSDGYRFSRIITIKEGNRFKSILLLKSKPKKIESSNKKTHRSNGVKTSLHESKTIPSVLDKVLSSVTEAVKKSKDTAKKFASTYFSQKNVQNYHSSEIKTWCSKKKQNVWFSLMRIKNKAKKPKAQKIEKHVSENDVTKTITSFKNNRPSYTAVAPPASYDMTDTLKVGSLKKLFGTEMDKIMLITCLDHLSTCDRGNIPYASSRQECVRVSNYCRSRNIIDLPSKDILKQIVEEAKNNYRVTSGIISSFKNSSDWINHSKSYISSDDNLIESTYCYKD